MKKIPLTDPTLAFQNGTLIAVSIIAGKIAQQAETHPDMLRADAMIQTDLRELHNEVMTLNAEYLRSQGVELPEGDVIAFSINPTDGMFLKVQTKAEADAEVAAEQAKADAENGQEPL